MWAHVCTVSILTSSHPKYCGTMERELSGHVGHVCTGYDMDYTLIQYDVNAWEQRAYEYGLQFLRADGVPVEGLRFDPTLVIRGLIVDKERGNLLKVDRFGCAT